MNYMLDTDTCTYLMTGHPIGPLDTFIAAHAVSLGVPLVTHNLREFSRVPGLKLENWAGE